MSKRVIAVVNEDLRRLEIAINKTVCAQQALRPDAVPAYAPRQAADKYFREALFAYADARYLQESFWRDLARQHGVAENNVDRLQVDFSTRELFLERGD